MKHDEDLLFDMANDFQHDYKIDGSAHEAVRTYMRDYHDHQAAPLLADIAAKDARIAALEEALKFSHEAAVRFERNLASASGNVSLEGASSVFDNFIPEHPLLSKEPKQ